MMFETYPDMLMLEEFMEILGIGKNRAYALLDSGEVKCFRIGKKYKIPKKAVIDYIDNAMNKKSGINKIKR
ncbi:MAG: helix-turn-helix domain-containing protein [Phascolarctobacterium sp.]|nr:helix-turn-helix domain-containing protein [Phascolarctobacterium sp.]